jgi:hypothetical protein
MNCRTAKAPNRRSLRRTTNDHVVSRETAKPRNTRTKPPSRFRVFAASFLLAFWRFGGLALALAVAACSNPRTNAPQSNEPPPTNTARGGGVEDETARMPVSHAVGSRFRTTRTLRVAERTEQDELVIASEEVTLTTVLRVDESGRMLAVRRSWESSSTSLSRNGRPAEQARGDLNGCTLELTQRASGAEARVIVGEVDLGRQQLLIEGFDTALLPVGAIKRSQVWEIEGAQVSELNRLIEAMGFKVERNRLICAAASITENAVEISLDWRVTAEYNKRPAVLRFAGALVYDRKARLVRHVTLSGGRLGDDGPSNEVEIRVKRQPVDGWLDFGE